MRKNRSVFLLVLAILLCLSLAACDQQPMPSETGGTTAGTDNSTTSADTPTTEATAATGIQIGTVDVQTLREGNWNSATTAGGDYDRRFLPGEGGFYCLIDGYLRFYDPSSNISVTLCQKVGCLHENGKTSADRKGCEASLGAEMIFAYESGYIYYDKADHGQPQLYRRNTDGTGEKHIAALCESHSDHKHTAQMESYLLSDGVLYYTVRVSAVVPDQNAALVSKDAYCALMRLELSSGKEEELLRVTNTSIGLTAAKKDAVVYTTMDLSYYDAPNKIEAMLNTPRYYYLWTKEADASQELLCKPMKECNASLSFDFGVIVAVESEPKRYYSYDLVTGEQQYLDRPGETKLNDNLYFDYVTDTFCDAAGQQYSNELLDLSGTEYNNIWISIITQGENGLILERYYFKQEESDFATITAEAFYYSYVPYEALTDGLQPEDVTDILSWEETYD